MSAAARAYSPVAQYDECDDPFAGGGQLWLLPRHEYRANVGHGIRGTGFAFQDGYVGVGKQNVGIPANLFEDNPFILTFKMAVPLPTQVTISIPTTGPSFLNLSQLHLDPSSLVYLGIPFQQAYQITNAPKQLVTHNTEGLRVRIQANQSANILARSEDQFDTTLSRLAALIREEEVEERPTENAFEDAIRLLAEVRPLFKQGFPRGAAATDSEGGVNLIWSAPVKQLHLTIPAQGSSQGFIYHEDHQHYAIDRDISLRNLARWLSWFADV